MDDNNYVVNKYLEKLKSRLDQEMSAHIMSQINLERSQAIVAELTTQLTETTQKLSDVETSAVARDSERDALIEKVGSLTHDANSKAREFVGQLQTTVDELAQVSATRAAEVAEWETTRESYVKEITRLRGDCEKVGVELNLARAMIDELERDARDIKYKKTKRIS